MRLINHPRLWVDTPNIAWGLLFQGDLRELWNLQAGHGGDEYGNCSLYFSCPLVSVVLFPGLCFQREVEAPGPGEHPFTDAMYYPEGES